MIGTIRIILLSDGDLSSSLRCRFPEIDSILERKDAPAAYPSVTPDNAVRILQEKSCSTITVFPYRDGVFDESLLRRTLVAVQYALKNRRTVLTREDAEMITNDSYESRQPSLADVRRKGM